MPARTVSPNGTIISAEQLMTRIQARYAGVAYDVPDYDTPIRVQAITMGDEEHCADYARQDDGERDWEAYARIWVAYGLAEPKLSEEPNRIVAAEIVADILLGFPKDWVELVFYKSLEMTNEYRRRRADRERELARGEATVFPSPDSAPSSSETGSESSTPAS